MHVLDNLLIVTFATGLALSGLFCYRYARHSRWSATGAGRAVMALVSVLVLIYASNLATMAWPGWFRSEPGLVVRLVIRVACIVVLVYLNLTLTGAQRQQRRAREDEPPALEEVG